VSFSRAGAMVIALKNPEHAQVREQDLVIADPYAGRNDISEQGIGTPEPEIPCLTTQAGAAAFSAQSYARIEEERTVRTAIVSCAEVIPDPRCREMSGTLPSGDSCSPLLFTDTP
jgi:hypothetical protein